MDELRRIAESQGLRYTHLSTGENSRLLWSSINGREYRENTKLSEIYEQNAASFFSSPNEDMSIFRSVNPASWSYTKPQKTLEDLLSLKPGQDVFMFDIENVGTFNGNGKKSLDWYSPTEIAFRHAKVNENFTFGSNKKGLSLLVRPTDDALSKIDEIIGKVSGNTPSWKSLSNDERRTLNDLILYADENPFQNGYFSKNQSTGATYLNKQLRQPQAPEGFMFTPKQVDLIKRGRQNLAQFGSTPDQVVTELANYMGDTRNFRLGGFNIDAYDRPMIMDFMNKMQAQVKSPAAQKALERLSINMSHSQNIDTYQVMKVLYKDQASKFGKNMKQEYVAKLLGINTGQSHQGLDDLNTTMQIHNHLMTKTGIIEAGKKSATGGPMLNSSRALTASFDMTSHKIGDELFSISGLSSNKTGKYDMTYKMQDGKMVPIYDNLKTSPLLRNTKYILDKTTTMDIDGVKHYGVGLRNEEDGFYHMLFRQDADELKSVISQNLVPYSDVAPEAHLMKDATKMDRARRRYTRMFSPEGGTGQIKRMFAGLDAGPNATEEELAKAMGSKTRTGFESARPEFVRDFHSIKSRLEAERPFIEEFLGELDKSPLKGNRQAEGVALNNFRLLMDDNFGRNETKIDLPSNERVAPIRIDGEEQLLSLRTNTTIESGIKRMVNNGYEYANPSTRVVKQRLHQMLDQLYTKGQAGLSSSAKNRLKDMVNGLKDGDAVHNLYTEIAGRIEQELKNEKDLGLKTMGVDHITVEDPFKLNQGRESRLHDPKTGFQAKKTSIFQKAISNGSAFASRGWNNGGLNVDDPILQNMLSQHDKTMAGMIEGIGANNSPGLKSNKAADTLGQLASAFAKDDVEVGFLYDEKHNGLVMALTNKKQAAQIFGLQANEIIEHSKVAAIKIPMLDANGKLVLPGQERVSRLLSLPERNGGVMIGTGFDAVAQQLLRSSKTIREWIGTGKVLDSQSWGNSIVRDTIQSLSLNNRKMSDTKDILNYDDKKSKLARRLVANQIDVTGFAQEWYKDIYGHAAESRKINEMKNSPGKSFYDTLIMDETKRFSREIDGWLANNSMYKLNTNMLNVKDVHASNNIRSSASMGAQDYTPFGYFNSMTRENIQKSVNYLPMDRQRVVAGLSGTKSATDVNRYLNRGLTTDTAMSVMDGELGYLNVRAAYMNDGQLTNLARQNGVAVDPLVNTYEGTFIINKDVASSLHTVREKNIRMAEGSTLNDSIWSLLKENSEVDELGVMRIKDGLTPEQRNLFTLAPQVDEAGNPRKGQYTVGKLMKDDNVRQEYFYKGNSEQVLVKGYDPNRNMLILDEIHQIQDGDKIITDAGHRVTARLQGEDWFKSMGINADVVLPEMELKKEQFGSFVKSQVGLVIDEAQRKINSDLTVGELKKSQMLDNDLNTITELMQKHLGVSAQEMKVVNGQVVMSGRFGLNNGNVLGMSKVQDFMKSAINTLGLDKNLLEGSIMYGQEGLGIADVYNWENSMGRTYSVRKTASGKMQQVENVDGLVRWGLKEVEAISSRADRYLGAENEVSKWIGQHVSTVARAQNSDIEGYARGLVSASLDLTDDDLQVKGQVRAGEVVIKTRGESFSISDREGKNTARVNNGVTEVSMHAFNSVPDIGYKGEKRTVGDYQKTVVSMYGTDVDIYDGDKISGHSLDDAIRANNGTALFELPDDTFGRKYVRFINSDIASLPVSPDDNMPVLDDIQRSQLRIAETTKEYQQNPNFDNRLKLKNAINTHDQHVNKSLVSSSGKVARNLFGSMQDMSGRFRVQGVNPIDPGNYKEGSFYVGKERLLEMIDGAEENIAKNVFKMDTKGMDKAAIQSAVLDQVQTNGLYGFVNRYPTIHESTNTVLKVEIDQALAGKRNGILTVGTSAVLNADYDGDFISNVFAHYKYNKAGEIHNAMGEIHSKSLNEFEEWGAVIRNELSEEASKQKVSVGDLWSDPNYRKSFAEEWTPRVGGFYDQETAIARLGKGDVGVLDNLRLKLSNRTNDTFSRLVSSEQVPQEAGRLLQDQVDEFGRLFSQKAISSKKFQVASIEKELAADGQLSRQELDLGIVKKLRERDMALQQLQQGIKTPNAEGLDMIRQANKVLDIYSESAVPTEQRFSLDEMLGGVQKSWDMTNRHEQWLDDPTLKFSVSGGTSPVDTSKALRGQGGMTVMTPFVSGLAEVDPRVAENLSETDRYTTSVIENAFNRENNIDNMGSLLRESTAKPLSSEMLGNPSSVSEASANRMSALSEVFSRGFGGGGGAGFGAVKGGAGIFAGLWAMSAITRNGPTPEETIRGRDGVIADAAPRGSAMPMVDRSPTARVSPNESGEQINISISASKAAKMSEQQIAALVHSELSAQMPMTLNMNMNVQDNTQKIDQQYLQNIVAQSISTGRIV